MPTVWAKAYCLANPATRARTVIAPMSSARARDAPRRRRTQPGIRHTAGPVDIRADHRRRHRSLADGGSTAAAGRRPSMSSRLSTGLPAMTLVKLIFSAAAVSAATVPSSDQPAGAAELGHGGEAEQGAERVGAGVAEHRPLAEVLGQQRGGGAQRDGGQRRRQRRVTDDDGREQRPAGEQADLDRPAGAQVEQVGQVGGARRWRRR